MREPTIIPCALCGEAVGAMFAFGHPIPAIYHIPCAERDAENERAAIAEEEARTPEKIT